MAITSEHSHKIGPHLLPVPPSLREQITAWAKAHKGRLYAPISHPELSDFDSVWPAERFEVIAKAVPPDAKTALDIGAHWGFFSLGLAGMGLTVTAIESNPKNAHLFRQIAEVSGQSVDIRQMSVFEFSEKEFDVVLALNIFHHFLRNEEDHRKLMDFLGGLKCRVFLYQAHSTAGKGMQDAYANYAPEEMCSIICQRTGLSNWEYLDVVKRRPIYKIF